MAITGTVMLQYFFNLRVGYCTQVGIRATVVKVRVTGIRVLLEFANFQLEIVRLFLIVLNSSFRVKQCRTHSGDHEAFPIHSMVDNTQCADKAPTERIARPL